MTVAVVLNPRAGGAAPGAIERAIRDARPDAAILRVRRGSGAGDLARHALEQGARVVMAGGGDGTIRAVAEAVAGTEAVLGVLPLGTRNHFARHLGIPEDVPGALRLLLSGRPLEIDTGEANGRVFLLYCALGLYPLYVRERERRENGGSRHSLPALAGAFGAAFRRFPRIAAALDIGGKQVRAVTPFVFLTNKIAMKEHLPMGAVSLCPAMGELGVYFAHGLTRWGALRLMAAAWRGSLQEVSGLETHCAERVRLEVRPARPWAAMDGEALRLESPVEVRVRRGALKVLAP